MKRTVIITGCTRGLGWAMSEGFASAGWNVVGCGRNVERIAELGRSLPGHLFAVADTTDEVALGSLAQAALEKFGPPHLLLNNAALINRNARLWEVSAAEFSQVIDVNLKGVHLVLRAFLPAMVAARRGVIVNFSSGWGRSTSPEVAPYCATKWGIEGLTQALAQELPEGMAAVALNPGIIDTEMLRSCFGEAAGSYPSPQAWAKKAVPFLAALSGRDNGASLTVK